MRGMRLLPPDSPVTDPFFAAVRRQHPDVDLVLLPPPARVPDQPPAVVALTDAEAAALRVELAGQAVRLWPVESDRPPGTDLRYGSDEAAVRAEARLSGRPDDPVAFVATLRDNISASMGASARVTHAPTSGLVVLTLTSPDVVVGVQRARALVRAGDR